MSEKTNGVDLKHLASVSSEMSGTGSVGSSSQAGSWQNEQVQVGRINPTYQTISESERCDSIVSGAGDPALSDRMYDVVGKEKESHLGPPPLPLPAARHTTSNTLYASKGDTLSHPVATLEKPTFSGPVESETEYSMGDSDSFKCCRVVCLSLLVFVSLLMACVAVVLVLLLWFGVFVPDNVCPTSTTTTTTAAPCTCPDVDLEPYYSQVNAQAAFLNDTINELQANLSALQTQISSSEAVVATSLNQVEFTVNNVTNTCVESLEALASENVTLAGLNFEAQLLDVGVFNSCMYEYLEECEMPVGVNNCSTNPSSILYPGYFNLDIACHVEISAPTTSVLFAAVSNLRISTANGTDFASDASTSEVLEAGQMRCDCVIVPVVDIGERTIDFTCRLFRARCPISSTLNTTIVTPP